MATLDELKNDLNNIKNILKNYGVEAVPIITTFGKEDPACLYGINILNMKKVAFIIINFKFLNYGPFIYKEKLNEFKKEVIQTISNPTNNDFKSIDPNLIKAANIIKSKPNMIDNKNLYVIYTSQIETLACTVPFEDLLYRNSNKKNLYDDLKFPLIIIVGNILPNAIRLQVGNDSTQAYELIMMILSHEIGHNFGQEIKIDDLPRFFKYYNQYVIDQRRKRFTNRPSLQDISKAKLLRNSDHNSSISIVPGKVGEVQADKYAYNHINDFDPNINRDRAGKNLGELLALLKAASTQADVLLKAFSGNLLSKEKAQIELKKIKEKLYKIESSNPQKDEVKIMISNLKKRINKIEAYIDMYDGTHVEKRKIISDPTLDAKTNIAYGAGGGYATPYYRKKMLTGDMYKQKEYKPTQTYDHREYYDKQKNQKKK